MTNAAALTKKDIDHIAGLANLSITDRQSEELVTQLEETVTYVSALQKISTENIPETSQVTNTENVYRKDEIDSERLLSQKDALSGKKQYKGFFVVDAVFDREK